MVKVSKIVFKRMEEKAGESRKVAKATVDDASKHSKVPKVSLASLCPRNSYHKLKLKIIKREFNRSHQINVVTPNIVITVGEKGSSTSGSNSSFGVLHSKSN